MLFCKEYGAPESCGFKYCSAWRGLEYGDQLGFADADPGDVKPA